MACGAGPGSEPRGPPSSASSSSASGVQLCGQGDRLLFFLKLGWTQKLEAGVSLAARCDVRETGFCSCELCWPWAGGGSL